MQHLARFAFVLVLSTAACRSTATPRVVEADPALRQPLFAAVAALEGRWQLESPEGPAFIEFALTAGGSAVRETMFPGTPHEMVNMYTLDGNGLAMTHYCAAGNQPHMRADALEGGRLAFRTTGVSDLKAADEHYMGAMTLVLVDADHVEQHWVSLNAADSGHMPVFALTRVR
jgi:hypothetical protein